MNYSSKSVEFCLSQAEVQHAGQCAVDTVLNKAKEDGVIDAETAAKLGTYVATLQTNRSLIKRFRDALGLNDPVENGTTTQLIWVATKL